MIKKGVILAGGTGSRLYPATRVTNKHLLSVFNKPMIYYPLETLVNTGVKRILIVLGGNSIGDIANLFKSGKEFGVDITYRVQNEAGGIGQAVGLAKDFVGTDNFVVILGDNYFEENITNYLKNFKSGMKLLLTKAKNPKMFGVATIKNDKLIKIVEKPKNPESNLIVTGCYVCDSKVFDIVKNIKPSARGELEMADIINHYINKKQISHSVLKGVWFDMGTPESLVNASLFIKEKEKNQDSNL